MFYRYLITTWGIISLLFASFAYGETNDAFPPGCKIEGFGYDGTRLVFNETGKQSFFLIKNYSAHPIKMQRVEIRDVFMSPPLTAQLEPGNWAAFASAVSNFHFECLMTNPGINENTNAALNETENKNETISAVDCRDVLQVCEYPRVRFALSNEGNYWVAVNKAKQQIIDEAVAKGIWLKW